VYPSLCRDEEVDGRSEVYVRRLGTAECPHFLAGDETKELLYSRVSDKLVERWEKFRVGELISTGTETLNPRNTLETQNKMKSCAFLDDVETVFMGTRDQYTIQTLPPPPPPPPQE
jgi:hypothetical protein